MATRARWDPALHPRGPVGRFIRADGPPTYPSGGDYDIQRRGFEAELSEEIRPDPRLAQSYRDLPVSGGDLSLGQAGALAEYSDYANGPINQSLRYPESDPFRSDIERDRNQQRIRDLDEAIEQAQLTEDTAVYRGVADVEELGWNKPGAQIWDRGFMSTSLDPAVTRQFGNDMLEIVLPAGTHVGLPSRDHHKNSIEAEVLVGRGSVLQIRSVERNEDDFGWSWRIRAELVGYLED